MRGEVLNGILTSQDAAILLNLTQVFYLDEKKHSLVVTFNERPSEFDFTELFAGVSPLPEKDESQPHTEAPQSSSSTHGGEKKVPFDE